MSDIHYAHAEGQTLDEMRRNIPRSLYNMGDAMLVWVNQGRFWLLPHVDPKIEVVRHPIPDARQPWADEYGPLQSSPTQGG